MKKKKDVGSKKNHNIKTVNCLSKSNPKKTADSQQIQGVCYNTPTTHLKFFVATIEYLFFSNNAMLTDVDLYGHVRFKH